MEYTPYNADDYIDVTFVNGSVTTKHGVCHRCFNQLQPRFDDRGWFVIVGDVWPMVREAAYLIRDTMNRVTDADGWHALKSAHDYLWTQEPSERKQWHGVSAVSASQR
jgi:hypothetical protein